MFHWEVDTWEEFISTIEGVILVEGLKNHVIWAPSNSGKFSCRLIQGSPGQNQSWISGKCCGPFRLF